MSIVAVIIIIAGIIHLKAVADLTKDDAQLSELKFEDSWAVDTIDMKKVEKHSGALSVVKNRPRLWTVDYIGVKAGTERDHQGLKARWVM